MIAAANPWLNLIKLLGAYLGAQIDRLSVTGDTPGKAPSDGTPVGNHCIRITNSGLNECVGEIGFGGRGKVGETIYLQMSL